MKSEATCPVSVLVRDDFSLHVVSLSQVPLALKQKMLPLGVGASTETVLSQVLTSWNSEYPGSIPSCASPSLSKTIISIKKKKKQTEKDHVTDSSSSGWVLFLRRQRRTQIKSELFNTARRTLRVKPCSLPASSSVTSSNRAGAALDSLLTSIDSVLLGWWRSSYFLGAGDQVSQVMLVVKSLPANAGDARSTPGLGRYPGVGNGNPLQYSCLANSMDREAWRATVHGVAKSWTLLEHRGIIFLYLLFLCFYSYLQTDLAFSMIGDPFPSLLNSPGPQACYPPAFMLHCKNLLYCVSFPLYLNTMRNGTMYYF